MASKLDPEIKRNILRRRKELKISQAEMAQQLNIDRNTYRYIETGGTTIVSGYLDKIADILGTTAEELLIGFDPYDIDSDPRLEEFKVEFGKKHQEDTQRLLERIASLEGQLAEREEKIGILKNLAESKDEIIEYLKSNKSN